MPEQIAPYMHDISLLENDQKPSPLENIATGIGCLVVGAVGISAAVAVGLVFIPALIINEAIQQARRAHYVRGLVPIERVPLAESDYFFPYYRVIGQGDYMLELDGDTGDFYVYAKFGRDT